MEVLWYWSGEKWKYNNVTFHSAVEVIKPYSTTSESISVIPKAKKPRADRSVNNLVFCPEDGCIETFSDEKSLTNHMLSADHSVLSLATAKSMTDRAKLSYISKMKNANLSSSDSQLPLNSVTNTTTVNGQQNFTSITGWGLPKRKPFRYSTKQKTLLMEMFLEGEESGKKMSPEQVHQHLLTCYIFAWCQLSP